MSENIEKLRHMWARMVTLGASDNDLHQLITLAQDMELARVCAVLQSILEIGAGRLPPQVLDLLRLVMEELETKSHRPKGYK